jgi:cytosine/adenosine deaminase-related metal-dependent hydrolase
VTGTLLRGGCLLTLGTKTPNFAQADLLIEDGTVVEVGRGLRARDAETVDVSDTVVMPGFVDTHRHALRSLFRNDGAGADPFSVGEHYRAEDVYAATLIGLLGAAEAGITTVVDWFDAPPVVDLVDAALQAHADAGVRTVFVLPAGDDGEGGSSIHQLLGRVRGAAGPRTTIAAGSTPTDSSGRDGSAGDWVALRAMDLRIHVHPGPAGTRPGAIADVAERQTLGEDVTFVHCPNLDDADVDAIASSGASVSLSPSSEMAGGSGSPPIQQLIDRDIRPGLGIDDERAAPGDMFAQMRTTISLQHATVFDLKLAGKAGIPRMMNTRQVIRSATVDGAEAVGLGGVTGSLEPGKRADVVVLRTDRPNIFPINDPIGAVVWGMDTSNIDWVFVDGRVVMRDGALDADVAGARAGATSARDRVATAAGRAVGSTEGAGR